MPRRFALTGVTRGGDPQIDGTVLEAQASTIPLEPRTRHREHLEPSKGAGHHVVCPHQNQGGRGKCHQQYRLLRTNFLASSGFQVLNSTQKPLSYRPTWWRNSEKTLNTSPPPCPRPTWRRQKTFGTCTTKLRKTLWPPVERQCTNGR